jgi:hypothetical protein
MAGVIGPLKLMNRDNAAAAAAGTSAAQTRALEVSASGAVRLTLLAGMLLHHKDDKKGQQDSFRIFFELHLGYAIRFPDTSNTRFQSHCNAAAELIIHLPFYLEFLLLVRDKKEKRNFNHLEANVVNSLKDIPTLTELCVLALYSQAISHPYMRMVRGSGERRMNALELGPLHTKVQAHCHAVIGNPKLLLASDFDYKTGALDSKPWERPELFYAVQRMADSLPHLEPCLVAFFKGALETWERFSSEFTDGGAISQLSEAEKETVFIPATNDHNEGALGSLRQTWRHAPNMTIGQYNARTLYKLNNTSSFVRSVLGPQDKKFLRQEARKVDGSGAEERMRKEQAQHDQQTVDEKRKADIARREKLDAREAQISAVTPILDVAELKRKIKQLTNSDLTLQINWHRRYDTEGNILSRTVIGKMKKDDKMMQLIVAIERYNILPVPPTVTSLDRHDIPDETEMDWEAAEDIEDADMED